MKRGDLFDARLSPTEGSEQAGVREVFFVINESMNKVSSVNIVLSVTSAKKGKRSYPNNVLINAGEGGLTADSVALGGQVRAITKARLLRQRGSLSPQVMTQIDQILRITLDL